MLSCPLYFKMNFFDQNSVPAISGNLANSTFRGVAGATEQNPSQGCAAAATGSGPTRKPISTDRKPIDRSHEDAVEGHDDLRWMGCPMRELLLAPQRYQPEGRRGDRKTYHCLPRGRTRLEPGSRLASRPAPAAEGSRECPNGEPTPRCLPQSRPKNRLENQPKNWSKSQPRSQVMVRWTTPPSQWRCHHPCRGVRTGARLGNPPERNRTEDQPEKRPKTRPCHPGANRKVGQAADRTYRAKKGRTVPDTTRWRLMQGVWDPFSAVSLVSFLQHYKG